MRYFSLVMPLILLCLSISISDGKVISGFVISTPGCSVRVHRQTPWADDEVRTITDGRGYWEADCHDFYVPLNPGNGFYVDYGWNLGNPLTLTWRRGRDSIEILPDVYLDQFTVCLKDIIDSSHIPGDLKLYYQLMPRSAYNPKPLIVDTGRTEDAFFNIHLPLPKYRVFSSSILYLKLFKTFGPAQESVAYTERLYDPCPNLNVQVLEQQLRFPEQRTILSKQDRTGSNLTTARAGARQRAGSSRLIAAPSGSGDRPAGVLFNALGQRIPDRSFKKLTSGTYFVVTEDPPMVRRYVISH